MKTPRELLSMQERAIQRLERRSQRPRRAKSVDGIWASHRTHKKDGLFTSHELDKANDGNKDIASPDSAEALDSHCERNQRRRSKKTCGTELEAAGDSRHTVRGVRKHRSNSELKNSVFMSKHRERSLDRTSSTKKDPHHHGPSRGLRRTSDTQERMLMKKKTSEKSLDSMLSGTKKGHHHHGPSRSIDGTNDHKKHTGTKKRTGEKSLDSMISGAKNRTSVKRMTSERSLDSMRSGLKKLQEVQSLNGASSTKRRSGVKRAASSRSGVERAASSRSGLQRASSSRSIEPSGHSSNQSLQGAEKNIHCRPQRSLSLRIEAEAAAVSRSKSYDLTTSKRSIRSSRRLDSPTSVANVSDGGNLPNGLKNSIPPLTGRALIQRDPTRSGGFGEDSRVSKNLRSPKKKIPPLTRRTSIRRDSSKLGGFDSITKSGDLDQLLKLPRRRSRDDDRSVFTSRTTAVNSPSNLGSSNEFSSSRSVQSSRTTPIQRSTSSSALSALSASFHTPYSSNEQTITVNGPSNLRPSDEFSTSRSVQSSRTTPIPRSTSSSALSALSASFHTPYSSNEISSSASLPRSFHVF